MYLPRVISIATSVFEDIMARTFPLVLSCILLLASQSAFSQWNPDPAEGMLIRTETFDYYPPTIYPSDSGSVFVLWGGEDTLIIPPLPVPMIGHYYALQKISADGKKLFGDEGRYVASNTGEIHCTAIV